MIDFGFYNMDCMEGMREFPDNYFELAIVDPPYGDALSKDNRGGYWNRFGQRFDRYKALHIRSKEAVFDLRGQEELGQRNTEKNHNVGCCPGRGLFQRTLPHLTEPDYLGGGNYFQLPPTRCFLVWRKLSISESFSMAMAEYAWTSFQSNAKVFEHVPQGDKKDKRFHPTQKPVALYEWILSMYAKPGDKILDTHVGSASSLVACYNMGFDFVGFEIDKDYYEKAKARLEETMSQIRFEL